jgi:pilus assembly protein CpaC
MKATKLFCAFLSFFLALGQIAVRPAMSSENGDYANYELIQMLKGDVYTVQAENLSRVSVTDPNVADINNAKPQEVTLVGKEVGQTTLFVWDDKGKRTFMVHVFEEDLGILKTRIDTLIASAGLEGVQVQENANEGKVVLTGKLPEDKMGVLDQIIDSFSEKVISFVKKELIQDQIQIDVQVTEIATSLTKEMGVDWATGTQTIDGNGQVTTTVTGDSVAPMFGEIMPKQDGSIADMFKLGNWYRTTNSALIAKVNMLIKEGKAKILSKPRLVVVSGKEAAFLVGGEIPIKTTTTNATGGSSQENVEFKEYGISLAVTPTINDGKVDIHLNVEISDIDPSKPTGTDVAFVTRSAQTQLRMEDRQTIVLAGLIKHSRSVLNQKVPFLGSLPIVGLLFRSKKNPAPDTDTEIVISLTPTILGSAKKATDKKAPAEPAVTAAPASFRSEPIRDIPPAATAPVLTKNAAGQPVTVPANIEPYVRSVQEKISASIAYPYEAQENGWQGTVKLTLIIRRDGSLRDVLVKESSGYDVFDKDAVNTAQILAPYDPFPESIPEEQLTVNIPIVYNLDSFLKNVAKHN